MPTYLLISQQNDLRRVAYLRENRVIDIDIDNKPFETQLFSPLNQIYWGQVIQVESSHVFVKITKNVIGLLPLEPSFPKPNVGLAVLVQVKREPIPDKGTYNKGPLLTRKILFGGRYCLLHPFQERHSLSSKNKDLKSYPHLQKLISQNTSITLRDAALRASLDDIQAEIHHLNRKFQEVKERPPNIPCTMPYDSLPSSHRWLRDLEALEQNIILVDHAQALADTRTFLKTYRPDLLPHLQKSKTPLFADYGLEEYWESLFQDVIKLPKGGNVVIDITTAAIVIDINQENRDIDEVNKEAIPIIVQHLKGRHLGGNIIIDFIGTNKTPSTQAYLKKLIHEQAIAYDLPLKIFGWSKLGWMEARLAKQRLPLHQILNLVTPP